MNVYNLLSHKCSRSLQDLPFDIKHDYLSRLTPNDPGGGQGWSGGAKVLGKLSVPGRPTSLDDSRARAFCACSRCGWGLFGHFFSHLSFPFSFSLSLGDGPI